MNAVIFTEDSNTTADDKERSLLEYYKGTFLPAKSLYEDLSEVAEPSFYVVSEGFGVADASRNAEGVLSASPTDDLSETTADRVAEEAPDADVMVLLFTSDLFESAVKENWNELTDKAKPDSVWCLSAPRSLLSEMKLSDLDFDVVTYERVGVARIDTETRERLLSRVE
jgi:hypothetical protein